MGEKRLFNRIRETGKEKKKKGSGLVNVREKTKIGSTKKKHPKRSPRFAKNDKGRER